MKKKSYFCKLYHYNMKYLISILILFGVFALQAQAPPQGINYQAVALDDAGAELVGVDISGEYLVNRVISVRFTIIKNTPSGPVTYREAHTTTTDDYGLFSLVIGQGVQEDSPMDFQNIQWGTGNHYLKVEIDINGGTFYKHMSTTQFWSVPYALYAKSAGNTLVPMYADQASLPTGNMDIGMLAFVRNCVRNGVPCMVIWDGIQWLYADGDSDPTNELGLHVVANNADRDLLYPNPVAGDMVWNLASNQIQVYNGTIWTSISSSTTTYSASNGLTLNGQTFQLGGPLTQPTAIGASATNTLAITGLQQGNMNTDNIVTINPSTGVLTQTSPSDLFQEYQTTYTASAGQTQFTTPITITNINKVNVYRNGIRIGHILINANTIQLEPGIICVNNDQIRIVQFR